MTILSANSFASSLGLSTYLTAASQASVKHIRCQIDLSPLSEHKPWRRLLFVATAHKQWFYFNHLNHYTDSHATKSSENKFAGKIRSFLNHALFYLCDTFPLFLPAQSWNNFIMPPAGAEQMTLRICARVLSRRHRFILTNGPEIGFFRSILTCCQTISVRDQVQQW